MSNIFTDIVSVEQTVVTFVKKELGLIKGDVEQVIPAISTAAQVAVGVVNSIKEFIASPKGQALEDVIAAVPGVGPYLKDVLDFLPQLTTGLGWVIAEFSKSPAQVVQDGFNTAINAITPDIKSTNLATAAAHLTVQVSNLAGAPVSIQGATTLVNAVYANMPVAA